METRCMSCMKTYDEKFKVCPHCGYIRGTLPDEPHHMMPESILHKKYIVGKVIGFGGFGVTYIGWDAQLNRKVAIKEYLPSEFATRYPGQTVITAYDNQSQQLLSSGVDSFIQEAQRLAKFDNIDGIVGIYDTFTENNTAYIVMEYLEGETLSSMLLNHGVRSYDSALNIVRPILRALSVVHANGIIHRDISPDNIFITKNGKVKLLDFGASRYATAYNSKDLSTIIKIGYTPPEQYESSGAQGPWSDNYAVAATVYKIITGITPQESLERFNNDRLVWPSKMGINISQQSERALMSALNLDPQRRPVSAMELLSGLEGNTIAQKPVTTKPAKAFVFPKWLKITTAAVLALTIVVVTLFATGITRFVGGKLVFEGPVEAGFVRVPDVINKSTAKAEKTLTNKKLSMIISGKEEFEDIEKDLVCKQTPQSGEKSKKNSEVDVVVSTGPKVRYVPAVTNYTQELAENDIKNEGLTSDIKQKNSDTVGKGGVIEQNKDPQSEQKSGDKVILTISKGPKVKPTGTYTMTKIVGKDFDTARQELLDNDVFLLIKETKYSDTVPENQIMSQSVEKGKTVNKGDNVYVTVSLGKEKVRVPDVTYYDKADAEKMLKNAGMKSNTDSDEDRSVKENLILRQSVESGTLVEKGSTVTITVNKYVNIEPATTNESETTTKKETTTSETTTTTTTKKTEPAQIGVLSGIVRNSNNNKAIPNVTVKAIKGSSIVKTVKTDSAGKYSLELIAGDYKLNFTHSSYYEANTYATAVSARSTNVEQVNMLPKPTTTTTTTTRTTTTAASKYTLKGYVTNSLDGNAISGVSVKVRKGSNKTSGSYESYSATTNSSGAFTLTMPKGDYTLELSKSGYVTTTSNVSLNNNINDKNISITPVYNTEDITITLNWGAEPLDLDAHLLFDGNEVCYTNYSVSGFAELDIDDRSSYGPETITIYKPDATTYTYYVYNFSGEPSITTSNATVTVSCGNRQIAYYQVPTSGEGRTWKVFSIRGETITTSNYLY